MADGGWTNWSEFDQQPLTIGPITAAFDRDWKDTWRVGIGVEYKLNNTWMLRGGFSYDSSPVDDDKVLPDLPVGDQYRFSVGVQKDFGQGKIFGIGYTLLYSSVDVDSVALPPSDTVVLSGEYDPNMIHFLSMNLTLSF